MFALLTECNPSFSRHRMDITFATKSKFFDPINSAIEENGPCKAGSPITVLLTEEGYEGEIHVHITPDSTESFATDWEGSDPTRFPARIRAAATVLKMRRCYGQFLISHEGGILAILPLSR
jgi:hypothetical protein